jgi:hypothetical protein
MLLQVNRCAPTWNKVIRYLDSCKLSNLVIRTNANNLDHPFELYGIFAYFIEDRVSMSEVAKPKDA